MWAKIKELANEALLIAAGGGLGREEFLVKLDESGLADERVVLLDRDDGEYKAVLREIPFFGNASADLVFDVLRDA